MKHLLVLLVVLAAGYSAVVRGPATRANLIVGRDAVGDVLLYRTYLYRPPLNNTIQSDDFVYRGYTTTRISFIQCVEVGYTQYATPWIISGGLGQNNVTIRVQSARGYGYYYLIEIRGPQFG